MALVSKNPYTLEVLAEFKEYSDNEVDKKLQKAQEAYEEWRKSSVTDRVNCFNALINTLEEYKERIAKLMTLEMGKPIKQGYGEVDKCIWMIKHYIENAPEYVADEVVETEATKSYIKYDPFGVILGVMPWNFPLWQVLRFAVPTLIVGNTVVVKHASNVPQTSQLIEEIFTKAGFEEGIYQNLLIGAAKVERVIRSEIVQGVALTGSENAGKQVAAIAGSCIKKTVMELGGSDPFIVLNDADIEKAATDGVKARTRNNGQACNAAKRFILEEGIYEEFIEKYKLGFEGLDIGDPMNENIEIGPIVNEQGLKDIETLVNSSVEKGAKILMGGSRVENEKGYLYKPTMIQLNEKGETPNKEIPLYNEEIFGPVAIIIIAKDSQDAMRIANDTRFGLGSAVYTKDVSKQEEFIKNIHSGNVYINTPVSSDPRLPFGGIKNSGYGRELGCCGIREFVNAKTVWVK